MIRVDRRPDLHDEHTTPRSATSMNLARTALALFLLVACGNRAAAHADYEGAILILSDAGGRTFTVFCHYTDGIVCGDPVRLEVRDPAGQTVAQTHYARDVVIWHSDDGAVYAFAVDRDHAFWCGWVVEPGRLVVIPTTSWMVTLAVLAHVADGWRGYGFSVFLSVAGVLLYARRIRKKRTWRVEPPAITYCAIMWLVLVLMYGPLSLLLIAGFTAVITIPVVLRTRCREATACIPRTSTSIDESDDFSSGRGNRSS